MVVVSDIVLDPLFFWALFFWCLPEDWKRFLLIGALSNFKFVKPIYNAAVVLKGLYFILTVILSLMAFLDDLRRRVLHQLRTYIMGLPKIEYTFALRFQCSVFLQEFLSHTFHLRLLCLTIDCLVSRNQIRIVHF